MMDVCVSFLSDRTTFISFQLKTRTMNDGQGEQTRVTYSERTLAAVVWVLERWTSLTASLTFSYLLGGDLDEGSGLGQHLHTLPQFP